MHRSIHDRIFIDRTNRLTLQAIEGVFSPRVDTHGPLAQQPSECRVVRQRRHDSGEVPSRDGLLFVLGLVRVLKVAGAGIVLSNNGPRVPRKVGVAVGAVHELAHLFVRPQDGHAARRALLAPRHLERPQHLQRAAVAHVSARLLEGGRLLALVAVPASTALAVRPRRPAALGDHEAVVAFAAPRVVAALDPRRQEVRRGTERRR